MERKQLAFIGVTYTMQLLSLTCHRSECGHMTSLKVRLGNFFMVGHMLWERKEEIMDTGS